MKDQPLQIIKTRAAAASLLCALALTSCWQDFSDKLIGTRATTDSGIRLAGGSMTGTSLTLSWTEPEAVAYTGIRIRSFNGTTPVDEKSTLKGITTSVAVPLTSGTENRVTVSALYSTGHELEVASFNVTPAAAALSFIYSADDLNNVRNNLTGYYVLLKDIDMAASAFATNWTAIGPTTSADFRGTFDGNGHTISNLTISSSGGNIGLFGCTEGATIRGLKLESVNITGNDNVGALVGYSNSSTVTDCTVSGSVTGTGMETGGLVGYVLTTGPSISYCSSSAVVSGSVYTGGLVGYIDSYSNTSDFVMMSNCFSTGTVKGTSSHSGGLIGGTEPYEAAGSGIISNCYSTGNVSGSANTGGLVGYNRVIIENCYATGAVTGSSPAGGLVGYNYTKPGYGTAVIENCYATGAVTGSSPAGGFVGSNNGTVASCYYNSTTSGQSDSYATGYTSAQMKVSSSYSGWDFVNDANGSDDYWSISPSVNGGYPYLTDLVP